MFLKCATKKGQYFSMHIVDGIPTVYYGDNEKGGTLIKTFPSRRKMREWVNQQVQNIK